MSLLTDHDGGGELVRCFVAVFLDAPSATRLQAAMAGRESVAGDGRVARPIPTRSYHVTLKFLGAIDAAAIAEAAAAVNALNGRPLEAAVTGLTGFPRPRAARLVAAELARQPVLEAWWDILQQRLGHDDRRFRPHVTVLRLRRPRSFRPVPFTEPPTVTLAAPGLYRSDPVTGGERYRPVARV